MDNKEEFKNFVRENKHLASYVRNNEKTWQDFYELYTLYKDDKSVWSVYDKNNDVDIESNNEEVTAAAEKKETNFNFGDIFNTIKNIDMNSLRQNIEGVQKGIGLLQDMIKKEPSKTDLIKRPRATPRRFED